MVLPRVILFNVVSLDGRIDAPFSEEAIGQFYGLVGQWKEDATLAGSDTLISSGATAAEEGESSPEPPSPGPTDGRALLVVPDSRGRIRNWHALRQWPYWRDVVALCSRSTPGDHLDRLRKQHVEYIVAGDDHVDYRAALEELSARYGVKVVRVDSGGTLNGALLRAGLVDEVSVLIHPYLVGGTSPRSLFRAPDLPSPEDAIKLRLTHVEKLEGDVVWLKYEVSR